MPILVNGEPLDEAWIRQEAAAIRAHLMEAETGDDQLTIDFRAYEWARENAIETMLLRQEAMKDATPIPSEIVEEEVRRLRARSPGQFDCILPGSTQSLRTQAETGIRLDRLISNISRNISPPKRKDVTEYYRNNRGSFYSPELVHAAHIVKNVDEFTDEETALQTITSAEQQIKGGRPFELVADELSDCPGRGGDLGFIQPGQMVEEFDAVVFALDPGQTSGIFRTPFGFHIAKVLEKRPEGYRSLTEVWDEIADVLLTEAREDRIDDFV